VTSGNGRPVGEEGDGADRRAPHGSDVRERRCLCQSAQSRREYAFRQIRQRGLGRVGPSVLSARAAACGQSGRIGQVFRSNGTSFEVEKTDKFCSDEKWTSSENGQVLSDWAGLGGRRWAAAGLEKE
jgi:hypothetical protein